MLRRNREQSGVDLLRIGGVDAVRATRGAQCGFLLLGASLVVAACGASQAEETSKRALAQFNAGQVCSAASLMPSESRYKTACEAQQAKEKAEREQREKSEAAKHRKEAVDQRATEKKEAAEHKATEQKEAAEHKKQESEEHKQENESAPHPESASSVPNVVGKSLPAAESVLESKGIQFSTQTINGDAVFLKSDWGVCSTTPGGNGSIVLHLGHFQCGA
jgi:hypothetical protein